MPNLQSRVSRRPDLLSTTVHDEVVIMDANSGSYFNLDKIGSDIWRRMETPIQIDQLCRDLAARYTADLDTICDDVIGLIEELSDSKLVIVED